MIGSFRIFDQKYCLVIIQLGSVEQYVEFDGFLSSVLPVTSGVPQGSVMGPFLFNAFINDIVDLPMCNKILYADDTVLYISDHTLTGCFDKVNIVLKNLSSWLLNNKLHANEDKTKLMLFTPKLIPYLPIISFNHRPLEWVEKIRYLGVEIDCELTFGAHVEIVRSKLNRLCGMFYSLARYLSRDSLLLIYKSLVLSIVNQNIIIWGYTSKTRLNNISICLNKILRFILNVGYDENHIPNMRVDAMYRELCLLKFKDIAEFALLKFYHNIYYNNTDVFLSNFSHLLPSHSYDTRSKRINLPDVRLIIEKQFTIFQMCRIINDLPDYLLLPQSLNSLKHKYLERALNSYTEL